MPNRDTIFALSSGRPPAGIAVVRLSGAKALETLEALAGIAPPPRVATLCTLHDRAGNLLDRALVLSFPAPHSFTGEDVVELHLHGGAAVIAAVIETLAARPGLRLAEPGEFSRRAFDSGKLDLTRAEGLADLIAAESEAQRRQALAQAGGRLAARAEEWRGRLLALQAAAEAGLDFSDEEDVDAGGPSPDLAAVAAEIAAVLDDRAGERLRDGFVIAFTGSPNVGKSSLINALAGTDVAIVTPLAGTTRDVLEVPMVLAGVPVTLLDTAGLRDSDDPIEAEGVRRARARAASADLVVHVVDADHAGGLSKGGLTVVNKIDLSGRRLPSDDGSIIGVSALTGENLDKLTATLGGWAERRSSRAEASFITRRRHRTALDACASSLSQAATDDDPVIYAEHLRQAVQALGALTGRMATEDMLDALFDRFCIGK